MRTWLVITAVAAGIAFAAPLHGQYPEGTGSGGGAGDLGHGDRMSAGRQSEHRLASANELEGPPPPDFMAERFELDSSEARAYRQVYDSFMLATKPARDSARLARHTVSEAFHGGDRQAARDAFPLLRRLGDDLAKEDDRFDRGLKAALTHDHLKAYRRWKADQRRQEEESRDLDGPGPEDPQ